jgi:hypothetical protein
MKIAVAAIAAYAAAAIQWTALPTGEDKATLNFGAEPAEGAEPLYHLMAWI